VSAPSRGTSARFCTAAVVSNVRSFPSSAYLYIQITHSFIFLCTVDIYDGDTEPMIFHGKTFTSKVSLREVCLAIAKYGFVASPYPIIISAEIHCSLPFQDLIAEIMIEVFGDRLVSTPVGERQKMERLPSPEELKGRILLKAKNLYVGAEKKDGAGAGGLGEEFGWASSASTSLESTAEDSEVASENRKRNGRPKRRDSDTMVKGLFLFFDG
jgi:phosphatidylinositol phospholipase C, delta